jgi:FtsH-binding integral membrane protein
MIVPKIIEEVYMDLEMGILKHDRNKPCRDIVCETLTIHCVVMVMFAGLLSFNPTFTHFFETNLMVGFKMSAYLVASPFIFIYYFSKKQYKTELVVLMIFTIYNSFVVGLTCALTNGRVIMESTILICCCVEPYSLYISPRK